MMCSHMPETTKPMAKPATPDAKPPRNAATRKSPTPMLSTDRSLGRGEQRLNGCVHLKETSRCPLLADLGKKTGPSNHCPLLTKETVLGPASLQEGGDRRRPPSDSVKHHAL